MENERKLATIRSIQNLKREFEQWCQEDHDWEVTEKLDGSSMTVYFYGGEFGVCSRNLELKDDPSNTYWKVAKELELPAKLEIISRNITHSGIAIQGELIGPGIQGNPYGLLGHEFRVYDIFDILDQAYLGTDDRLRIIEDFYFDHVPVLNNRYRLDPETTVGAILKDAEGDTQMPTKHAREREGLVFKRVDGRHSFKAISNKFLLKQEKMDMAA